MTLRTTPQSALLLLAFVLTAAWPSLSLAQDKPRDAELGEMLTAVPKLPPSATYEPKDNVIEIQLSKYAGYAGLIAANGGLDASDDSIFAKKHGFKVKITLSADSGAASVNSGRVGASAMKVDSLAINGRQLEAVAPMLISFSRGAHGVVINADIKKINNLRGKVLAAAQFSESDFFIRYLAMEAGMKVKMLPKLTEKPDAKMVNLIYCTDGLAAGEFYQREIKDKKRVIGCVTLEPKASQIVQDSQSKAHLLVSNRNLLIIADVLAVNKGFAQAHPEMVNGLVAGILEGNEIVRGSPDANLDLVGKAFGWEAEPTKAELARVHLANLPENTGFFAGTIASAGSFGYIFQTASSVYGSELIGEPSQAEKFVSLAALKAAEQSGQFKDQKASILPVGATEPPQTQTSGDAQALLSMDIRFMFQPNSSKLDPDKEENLKALESIAELLRVSPGSKVLLRGHADSLQMKTFRREGGQAKVDEMKLSLKKLAEARCTAIKQILQDKFSLDQSRIDIQGVGVDEPTGKGPDVDRRVEVQWFTIK